MTLQHGTRRGYTYYGCRCERCTREHTDYARAWQRKRFGFSPLVDAAPSRAMLACLLGFGVAPGRIGSAMGKNGRGKPRIRRPRVRASTAEGLARLHWGLWRTHGPFRRHCRCEVPARVLEELERAS